MKKVELYRICKLTDAGKEIASWEFDETTDMDNVRAVTNMSTGEVIFAYKVTKEVADASVKINPKIIHTEKGIWKLWHDGWNYIINREGDRV